MSDTVFEWNGTKNPLVVSVGTVVEHQRRSEDLPVNFYLMPIWLAGKRAHGGGGSDS